MQNFSPAQISSQTVVIALLQVLVDHVYVSLNIKVIFIYTNVSSQIKHYQIAQILENFRIQQHQLIITQFQRHQLTVFTENVPRQSFQLIVVQFKSLQLP